MAAGLNFIFLVWMVLGVIVAGIIKFINFTASIVDPLYKSITVVQSFFLDVLSCSLVLFPIFLSLSFSRLVRREYIRSAKREGA